MYFMFLKPVGTTTKIAMKNEKCDAFRMTRRLSPVSPLSSSSRRLLF